MKVGSSIRNYCCNPSLGLAMKARVCKRSGQEKDPGVCENVRMNTHTPK
jgi:hypothetical protein